MQSVEREGACEVKGGWWMQFWKVGGPPTGGGGKSFTFNIKLKLSSAFDDYKVNKIYYMQPNIILVPK